MVPYGIFQWIELVCQYWMMLDIIGLIFRAANPMFWHHVPIRIPDIGIGHVPLANLP